MRLWQKWRILQAFPSYTPETLDASDGPRLLRLLRMRELYAEVRAAKDG